MTPPPAANDDDADETAGEREVEELNRRSFWSGVFADFRNARSEQV